MWDPVYDLNMCVAVSRLGSDAAGGETITTPTQTTNYLGLLSLPFRLLEDLTSSIPPLIESSHHPAVPAPLGCFLSNPGNQYHHQFHLLTSLRHVITSHQAASDSTFQKAAVMSHLEGKKPSKSSHLGQIHPLLATVDGGIHAGQ